MKRFETLTWEETINLARQEMPELIRDCFLSEDLEKNVRNYGESEEFLEILSLIKSNSLDTKSILDVGSGNGITAINFALKGYDVLSIEPDKSETVGAGAIRQLKDIFSLSNIHIVQKSAEEFRSDRKFDVVFTRQSLHHANDLNMFVGNLSTHLKSEGLFLAVREHVIFNEEDKSRFLRSHPLQKYYGGENAYRLKDYKEAFSMADIDLRCILKFFDSPVNYYPLTKKTVEEISKRKWMTRHILKLISKVTAENAVVSEKDIPGRMYSFIGIKK